MIRRHHITLILLLTIAGGASSQPFQLDRLSYLGGGGQDRTVVARIANEGTVVIGGMTTSTDFPSTLMAIQPTAQGRIDGTVTVISPSGEVLASTYIGSSKDDELYDVLIESGGTILVAIKAKADSFPVTGSVGIVEEEARPLILRLSADLSTVLAAFHFKIDHSIDNIKLCEGTDGRIAVVGTTEEKAFPTTSNAMQANYSGDDDGILCVVDPTLTTLLYATYFGEEHHDTLQHVAFDANGILYVVGVIGDDHDLSAFHFISFNNEYSVKVNHAELNDIQRQTMSMYTSSTSVFLCMESTSGPILEVRSQLGVITRSVQTSAYLDAIRSCEADGSDVLISGSYHGQSTTARVDPIGGDTVWTYRSGGSAPDTCYASRLTIAGLVTAGSTESANLPTTSNAFQRTTKDVAGTVRDHWFSLATTTVPPKSIIHITPTTIAFDSVIFGTSRRDSIQCFLLTGPGTTITSASFIVPVPGLTVETMMPQAVTATANAVLRFRWTPADTGTMEATLRIITPDSVIAVMFSGMSYDTTSSPPHKSKPQVRLSSVDIGEIVLGQKHDAYMAIRTDSVKTLTFDSVRVSHNASVNITTPFMPRLAIVPDDQLVVGVTANTVGFDSAVVTLYYPDSTAIGVIHWLVPQPGSAMWAAVDIDRGTLVCGVSDTSYIVVQNVGTESGEIRDVTFSNDAQGEIITQHPQLPVTLIPGATYQIRVITTPTKPRDIVVRCTMTFKGDDINDDTLSVQFRYHAVLALLPHYDDDPVTSLMPPGTYRDPTMLPPPDTTHPVSFTIDAHSAEVGQNFTLALICTEGGEWLRKHQVQEISFTLTFRRSVLTIQPPHTYSVIRDEMRSVPITSVGLSTSDTAAVFSLTACLGDADSSVIQITDLSLLIDTGRFELDTTVTSIVHIIDTWPSNKPRHVVRDTTMPAIEIYPNPVVDVSTLSLHACAPGATVLVNSADGRFVFEWTSTMTEGVRDVHITMPAGLTPGMYVCTYRSNHTTVYRSFVVLR